MKDKKPLLALGIVLGATSFAFNAHAALTSYTGVGNVGLVYSSVSDVTWTQDANLFKTLYDADNNLINLIAAVTPTYSDPSYGFQLIDFIDYNTAFGGMSWWGGIAFANYLNSINYGGSNQWRLPTSNAISGYDGTTGNELGQLFYSELNGNIPNSNYFNNAQPFAYWSGTEYAPGPADAWVFSSGNHQQYYFNKFTQAYAWVVSPGQVAAVPVPGAIWLFATGLAGLLHRKRSGRWVTSFWGKHLKNHTPEYMTHEEKTN
ncbi:MAG: DUF1566 domain-containing protein [Methylomicrobium sp.]|nr:DUF1566 domain-containing protein [Methylomicrobium sp.]